MAFFKKKIFFDNKIKFSDQYIPMNGFNGESGLERELKESDIDTKTGPSQRR